MIVRLGLMLSCLAPASVAAQAINVYFYGAIVQAESSKDPYIAQRTDHVMAMSTRSREDARHIACARYDANAGGAPEPAFLEACLAGGESRSG
ncbi:MAG TPA: hypothetical protein PKJ45_14280 [Rubrivivax sp.]|nr:hypothetical protein [Rubrivivax sp.]